MNVNAAIDATVPRAQRPKVRPWEPEELGTFLDSVSTHPLAPLFELMALAGLRRGEACGLRWADVDLAHGILVVRQQLVQVYGHTVRCEVCRGAYRGVIFGAPKTASGEARRVDLGDRGIGVLLAHELNQAEHRAALGDGYTDHDLVFARPNGNPLAPEQVSKTFATIVRDSGLRRVRIHDLRHGRASTLLAAGADLAVVSKMLGHSSLTLTADTYSHLLNGVGRQAANAADALLPRRRDQSVTDRHGSHGARASPEGEGPGNREPARVSGFTT